MRLVRYNRVSAIVADKLKIEYSGLSLVKVIELSLTGSANKSSDWRRLYDNMWDKMKFLFGACVKSC